MKLPVQLSLSLITGALVGGWCTVHSLSDRTPRYVTRTVKASGLTEAEFHEKHLEKMATDDRCEQRLVKAALQVIDLVDQEAVAATRQTLASHVGRFYRQYKTTRQGDTDLIAEIEEAASTSPDIAAEINKGTPQ